MSRTTATTTGGQADPGTTFSVYESLLEGTGAEGKKLKLPKWQVPTLPERFERTWLATFPGGAIASYRDMESAVNSTHVNEFPGYWEVHVDAFNPHYYPVEHALVDAELVSVTADSVAEMLDGTRSTIEQTGELVRSGSQLGSVGSLAVGRLLVEPTAAGVAAGLDYLTSRVDPSG